MQLRHAWKRTASALVLCLSWTSRPAAAPLSDDAAVEALMQYFTDSQHVAVRSAIGNWSMPLKNDAALSLHWNNERVTIPAIEAPVGSQEAVDAITTASRPISGNAYQDFVKVRNEVQGGVRKGHATLDYYFSSESDYLGQQLAGSWNRDLAGEQLNLSFGASYGWDAIRPLADDDTGAQDETKTTLHWNAVATRVLGPSTVARVGVEFNEVMGLQHNPYRNVFAGGTNVAERHPDHRQRRDLFLKLNQYLANRSSVRMHYRLYNDDWGVGSHEVGTKLSQYVTHGVFASYEYRWYTQTSAEFYRSEYATVSGIDGYLSGDYRLSDLSSHLFGVSLDVDLTDLAVEAPVLERLALRCNYERYFNSNNYSANILTTQVTYRF